MEPKADRNTGNAAPAAAAEVIGAPLGQAHGRLSAVLGGLVPHRAFAELSGARAHSPFEAHGEPGLAGRITGSELAAIAAGVRAGRPWQGHARIAGEERPVLAVTGDATARGALLVLVRTEDVPVPEADATAVQAFWDLVTGRPGHLSTEAVPGPLAQSRTAAGERARAIAELSEAHAAALTALLGVLRSRDLDDTAARAHATELAVTSLVELRAAAERDQAVSEEPADQAFARLAESLRPLLSHGPVRLELGPPGDSRPLAADVVHAARAVVRAVVLAVLEQDPLGRVHVGWQIGDGGANGSSGTELRATVRDDGPGDLSRDAVTVHRVGERLAALGGRLDVDAVPGWGTTVTAVLPLGAPEAAPADPLAALGAREREVLAHLARGHRNRAIAQELHISESTVKFHVANILSKLSVSTRGEAAALAHTLRAA
ncbi:response regulator transcription factor family protein [Streptomyces sp. Wb2n-11]|uniref:helix-turn-helix transcriptional regulator n=1 Tax=Streptomyces sp. Wb2n-11 TaxID=1030533 RepID=UPI000A5D3CE9|nr:LuxR C-terminal-related transcriptional regulator [Streptomyces sp. Wb2n-11]